MDRGALAIVVAGAFATGLAFAPAAVPAPLDAAAVAKRPCTKGPCAVRKARALLRDRVLIRFVETGSIGNESSLDQRLHLCGGGHFIYDVVSYIPGLAASQQRTEGDWRVLSATFTRNGRRARARVRGTPDDGSPALTITVTANGSIVRVDGAIVTAQRSDLC
ncbi:MAG: hypothetical protein ACRDK0_01665 [Solirubrobacteraceae bacterium]